MNEFTVSQIIDGDTFIVKESWEWRGQKGDRVRPTGFDTPELPGLAAERKLRNLLLGQRVKLHNPVAIDRGRLVCEVYFRGHPIAHYFPTYQT